MVLSGPGAWRCVRADADVLCVSFQDTANATAENASATRGTSGTTVTAPPTSARAGARMARSAMAAGTASAGSASARSQEPLGRPVRSARPAQMRAAPRGTGPHHSPSLQLLAPPGLCSSPSASGRPASHCPLHPPCWAAKLLLARTKTASLRF